jgi:maleylpyruvate isomerase
MTAGRLPDDAEVPTEALEWWKQGEEHLGTALGRLVDEEFGEPSRLPGWTRAHVLGHLARNADAIGNLLTWARTGVETPMYASPEARDADIEKAAALEPHLLRADLLGAVARLASGMQAMPAHAWAAPIRTRSGRTVAAAEVPWMRAQEVWVHSVDLDAGVGFADIPEDVLAWIVDGAFRMWSGRDQVPDVALFAGDREWGTGSLAVAGTLPAVTAWVIGRSSGDDLRADGPLPELPAWL